MPTGLSAGLAAVEAGVSPSGWSLRRRMVLLIGIVLLVGCSDDTRTIRSIQADRQQRQQAETKVDHLAEAFSLVSRLVELRPEAAARQITYHLNAWQQARGDTGVAGSGDADPEAEAKLRRLLTSVADILPTAETAEGIARLSFDAADVEGLRYRYLARQVCEWVRVSDVSDPLWTDWVEANREALGADIAEPLTLAIRLFDWTVRNISLEPAEAEVSGDSTPPGLRLPLGMRFRGSGYRQTPYQTLFRGTGDALQRTATFLGLCRQAELPVALLATAPSGDSETRPWVAGVWIGGDVYLFDCGLGVPIVGPNQSGIATLAQARSDASVLRRMNVPGWFDYPFAREDVGQCVALLMLEPEAMGPRAKGLQRGLTGDLRMSVYDDPVVLADLFEGVAGIAAARIWDVPLKARAYRAAIDAAARQDPLLNFYLNAPWFILEGEGEQSQELAIGRWRHLQGRFDSEDDDAILGAKKLYLNQRQPEFEIADLRGNVELQMRYGIRRELRVTPEQYDMQIQQIQLLMRQGKVLASFWLSLIQYDTGRFDLARNWFRQRVLEDGVDSPWEAPARYNLARALERLGETEQAGEILRTEGDPQEHGNRIRARMILRGLPRGDSDVDAD